MSNIAARYNNVLQDMRQKVNLTLIQSVIEMLDCVRGGSVLSLVMTL